MLRIDVVLKTDAGEYECKIQRGSHTVTKKIRLIVKIPDIQLNVTHVYTICLRWSLTDDGSDIYSVCLSERTRRSRSLVEDLGIEAESDSRGSTFYCDHSLFHQGVASIRLFA
ncbi:hypothetical protein KIN20_001589 [Parelaphostrongylus tenuis]|uniref:Uncharacterized protein n=1 Tax=Parelaphostrongylus tenuis TaxID=148309 RepID=A0AAD5MD07_PARTN|nr:hypothetical protein KIN20_001589 [Parelaphostrongylus tenuis]